MVDAPAGSRFRVLILGGYGSFGGRLARLLAAEPGVELLIAGRGEARAAAFCKDLARATPLRLDRDGGVAAALARHRPDLLIDASGPFQSYGDRPYRVAQACIAARVHYLDLADGREFVSGIGVLDAEARAAGVAVLSGVSTLPALSFAALRALCAGLDPQSVTIGIAPSPRAGIGRNVIRGLAAYAGRPVPIGPGRTAPALIDSRPLAVAPPGGLPLHARRFVLCDVPDLALLPERWPGLQRYWIGAGTLPASLSRLASLAAWLVRLRLLPSLVPFAGLYHRASRYLRWGEHRGGMIVAVAGRDAAGRPAERSWHLVAEADNGPWIPAMAAAAAVRRMRRGAPPSPGARPATEDLELTDFAPFFAARGIVTGTREGQEGGSLFRRLLGPAFERLPAPIRRLHDLAGEHAFSGRAEVERGRSLPARLVGRLIGLPKAGKDLPARVVIAADPQRETWTRRIGSGRFRSHLAEGRGREAHLLVERFGRATMTIALVREGERLAYVVRGWRLCGVPMPRRLAPSGRTTESVDAAGRFRFEVEIVLPLGGLLARYRGWLA